jgi:two-component system NarL family sensor kinase
MTRPPTTRPEELEQMVAEHAARGAAIHVWLRGLLVVFALVTVLWEPPAQYRTPCLLLAIGYAAWAVGIAGWLRRDPGHLVRSTWLVLTVDLLLFGVLNQLAGVSDRLSWTAYILVNGFLLIPVLAAAQLRMRLTGAISTGAAVLYLLSSIAARQANGDPGTDGEPWASVLLRTLVIAAVGAGAVLLTTVQRSRVADIGRLAEQRTELLTQLAGLEDRQRRDLAESLHDGALQYLLGARLDLEDAVDSGDPAAFERVDKALSTSVALLRSTVAELHPAVLAQAGLAQALRDLAKNTQGRGRLVVDVTVAPPDDAEKHGVDLVLYSAVRELLSNVAKHAQAQHVWIAMTRGPDGVAITVTDDGRGVRPGEPERRLAEGHIGLSSHRLRVEAAGGRLTLEPAVPHGTAARVWIPTGRSDRRD